MMDDPSAGLPAWGQLLATLVTAVIYGLMTRSGWFGGRARNLDPPAQQAQISAAMVDTTALRALTEVAEAQTAAVERCTAALLQVNLELGLVHGAVATLHVSLAETRAALGNVTLALATHPR